MQPSQRTVRNTSVKGLIACGVLLQIFMGLASAARANDGVPAGIAKIEKTHQQIKTIDLNDIQSGARLQDFCIRPDGSVVALVAGAPPIGDAGADDAEAGKTASASQVCILDSQGELQQKWSVNFVGQAIATGPDGSVYVGGNGRMARFDAQGKVLAEAAAPQTTVLADKDELQELAQEQLESEKASAAEQIKHFEEMLKNDKQLTELQKQVDKRLEAQDQAEAKQTSELDRKRKLVARLQINNLKTIYTQQLERLRKQQDRTIESVIASMTARLQQVNAITTSGDDVFIACPMSKGYGYAVWRTDQSFAEPKQIIKGLAGCCGQMDIQAAGGEIFVAENSRHRVVRYDRDGKEVGRFGKTDREGLGEGFGGCCNPMNLCFPAEGGLLASESNGVVKRFTLDGKYRRHGRRGECACRVQELSHWHLVRWGPRLLH